MRFDKRKILAATAAGVFMVGTMSTVVMAGGKGEHSALWCRDTVCSEHGADCQNPGNCAEGTDCQKREDCVNGVNCQNHEACRNNAVCQNQEDCVNGADTFEGHGEHHGGGHGNHHGK